MSKRDDYVNKTWSESYCELLAFIEKNNGVFDYKALRKYDIRLYYWVNRQMLLDSNLKLRQEYRNQLADVGVILNRRGDDFLKHYNLLKDYYLEHGDCDIPMNAYINNLRIGRWANYKRRAYAGVKNTKITRTEIIYLNRIYFDWNPSDTIVLNKPIVPRNYSKYKETLNKRVNNVIRDISYEGNVSFNTLEDQKEIEKVMLKRIFK